MQVALQFSLAGTVADLDHTVPGLPERPTLVLIINFLTEAVVHVLRTDGAARAAWFTLLTGNTGPFDNVEVHTQSGETTDSSSIWHSGSTPESINRATVGK